MKGDFNAENWRAFIPRPVFSQNEEYTMLYDKAWELAYAHVKAIDGMPQTPYMDEGFCDTQIWIWDSCFMSLFCKYAQDVFPGKETLRNFYEVLYDRRVLPSVIPSENEPKWTGAIPGVPFPIQINIADNPPLFAWAEYENALFHGDKEYLHSLLYEKQYLQKHYKWLEGLSAPLPVNGVSVPTCWAKCEFGYKWEGGRSGMDNTPRGRKGDRAKKERPNNPDMLWIDAICEQTLSAKCISELFMIIGDSENSTEWKRRYCEKKKIVNEYYWDREDGFYYDIEDGSFKFYKVKTIASFWPLTAGIADAKQAGHLAKSILDPVAFGGEVPLVSLARADADFDDSGKYWRGSLWIPTAYMALKGLIRYGYFNEARRAACSILTQMMNTYEGFEPHTIWECYSPSEAKPATQSNGKSIVRKDFCGWSALGPISVYIEFVLGFYEVNAFEKVIKWNKPGNVQGKIGIKNLRFGDILTDIVAEGNTISVNSSREYRLVVNDKTLHVKAGQNTFNDFK